MQGARTLYTATLEGLKLETEYRKINSLIDTDKIPIIITVSIIINILPKIALVFLLVLKMTSGFIECTPWKEILMKKEKCSGIDR